MTETQHIPPMHSPKTLFDSRSVAFKRVTTSNEACEFSTSRRYERPIRIPIRCDGYVKSETVSKNPIAYMLAKIRGKHLKEDCQFTPRLDIIVPDINLPCSADVTFQIQNGCLPPPCSFKSLQSNNVRQQMQMSDNHYNSEFHSSSSTEMPRSIFEAYLNRPNQGHEKSKLENASSSSTSSRVPAFRRCLPPQLEIPHSQNNICPMQQSDVSSATTCQPPAGSPQYVVQQVESTTSNRPRGTNRRRGGATASSSIVGGDDLGGTTSYSMNNQQHHRVSNINVLGGNKSLSVIENGSNHRNNGGSVVQKESTVHAEMPKQVYNNPNTNGRRRPLRQSSPLMAVLTGGVISGSSESTNADNNNNNSAIQNSSMLINNPGCSSSYVSSNNNSTFSSSVITSCVSQQPLNLVHSKGSGVLADSSSWRVSASSQPSLSPTTTYLPSPVLEPSFITSSQHPFTNYDLNSSKAGYDLFLPHFSHSNRNNNVSSIAPTPSSSPTNPTSFDGFLPSPLFSLPPAPFPLPPSQNHLSLLTSQSPISQPVSSRPQPKKRKRRGTLAVEISPKRPRTASSSYVLPSIRSSMLSLESFNDSHIVVGSPLSSPSPSTQITPPSLTVLSTTSLPCSSTEIEEAASLASITSAAAAAAALSAAALSVATKSRTSPTLDPVRLSTIALPTSRSSVCSTSMVTASTSSSSTGSSTNLNAEVLGDSRKEAATATSAALARLRLRIQKAHGECTAVSNNANNNVNQAIYNQTIPLSCTNANVLVSPINTPTLTSQPEPLPSPFPNKLRLRESANNHQLIRGVASLATTTSMVSTSGINHHESAFGTPPPSVPSSENPFLTGADLTRLTQICEEDSFMIEGSLMPAQTTDSQRSFATHCTGG